MSSIRLTSPAWKKPFANSKITDCMWLQKLLRRVSQCVFIILLHIFSILLISISSTGFNTWPFCAPALTSDLPEIIFGMVLKLKCVFICFCSAALLTFSFNKRTVIVQTHLWKTHRSSPLCFSLFQAAAAVIKYQADLTFSFLCAENRLFVCLTPLPGRAYGLSWAEMMTDWETGTVKLLLG